MLDDRHINDRRNSVVVESGSCRNERRPSTRAVKIFVRIKKDEAIGAVEFLISGSNDDQGAICIGHKFNYVSMIPSTV